MTISFQRRVEFFEKRITPEGDCWRWTGSVHVAKPDKGGGQYGKAQFWELGVVSERWYAHRLSWVIHRSEIPPGLTIDHLCRNTLCVNPEHLDPVPTGVNTARAVAAWLAARPKCAQGHDDWAHRSSASGHARYCAECNRIRARRNNRKKVTS